MSAAPPAYLEIVDFIAGGTTPESVIEFRPSAEAQQRLAELTALAQEDGLNPDQRAELDHFMELEHILRLAKARARHILESGR